MIYLIVLFLIFYFILAWRRLNWAVLLLIAVLPAYLIRFKIFGVPFTLLEAMILISFAVWLAKNYKQVLLNIKTRTTLLLNHKSEIINQKLIKYPFGVEIILLLIVSYVAVFVAGFSNEALGIWKAYFFEPALLFILILNVFKNNINEMWMDEKKSLPPLLTQRGIEKIILALAVGALAVSILAIYQKITGDLIFNPLWANSVTRRVVSFFGYPNAVGLYLGPIVMVLVGYLFTIIKELQITTEKISNDKLQMSNQDQNPKSKKMEIVNAPAGSRSGGRNLDFICHWKFGFWNFKIIFITIITLFSLLSIYFAKSIGAIMGLAAAFFVFGILAGKKLRWATLILIGVVIIGLMAVPSIKTKAVNKILFQDLSGQIRLQQWHETWQMMTELPTRFIFGTGLSGYQKAIAPYHQEGIFFNSEREPFEEFHRKTVFNAEYKAKHWQPVEIYMYPHNILLNFWTELGLVGVIFFVWIIFKFLKIGIWNLFENWKLPPPWRGLAAAGEIGNSSANSNKYLNLGLMCAMIVLIIHGIVDVPYFKNDLAVLFWLLVTMMSMMKLESENKELKNK